ncbi:MAG: RNA 2',3'-cyclic phosphodiesterase [Maricaulaceae bacterium]
MRLFTALRPTPDIINELVNLQRGIQDARWVAPEKLHITTAFYGDVTDDQAELLDEALVKRPYKSFDLELEGVGHFGSFVPRAIWVGVKPTPALNALHERCRNAARQVGIIMEKRNFMPHVTLAYLPAHMPLEPVMSFEKHYGVYKSSPFCVDEMHMISSWQKQKGGMNIYRDEASYPFLGG